MSSTPEKHSESIGEITESKIAEETQSTATELQLAIERYTKALEAIETAESHPSEEEILVSKPIVKSPQPNK